MRRCAAWGGGFVLCALLGACGSPPLTRFHTLLPLPAPLAAGAADVARGEPALRSLSVVVPAALAQPQLLLREPGGALRLLEHERWVAPLDQELRRLLLLRLAERTGLPADAQLSVEVLQWEAVPGGAVRLQAHWQWQQAGRTTQACRLVTETPAGADAASLAAAHGHTAQRLAEAVAASAAGRCGG